MCACAWSNKYKALPSALSQEEDTQAYFRRIARRCDRVNESAKVPLLDGLAIFLVEVGRTYHITGISRRDTLACTSLELARCRIQRGNARLAVEELRSSQTTISHKTHEEASDEVGRPHPGSVQRRHGGSYALANFRTKDLWDSLEICFVQKLARASRSHATVPRGRWMIGDTP